VAGGASLASVLNLSGRRNFLLQHQLATAGRNYRVLDPEKHHYFTVRENIGQEMRSNFLGGIGQTAGSLRVGFGVGQRTYSWTVLNPAGSAVGTITIQVAGFSAVSTLTDSAGAPVLAINVNRGLAGGMTATAAFPDGRPMFQAKGNLIRHNFSIHGPDGQEVAKIHEAWASVRDTYNLDVTGNVDPLCALIFAIMIDREKASN
jgi:hypothetical protein